MILLNEIIVLMQRCGFVLKEPLLPSFPRESERYTLDINDIYYDIYIYDEHHISIYKQNIILLKYSNSDKIKLFLHKEFLREKKIKKLLNE